MRLLSPSYECFRVLLERYRKDPDPECLLVASCHGYKTPQAPVTFLLIENRPVVRLYVPRGSRKHNILFEAYTGEQDCESLGLTIENYLLEAKDRKLLEYSEEEVEEILRRYRFIYSL